MGVVKSELTPRSVVRCGLAAMLAEAECGAAGEPGV